MTTSERLTRAIEAGDRETILACVQVFALRSAYSAESDVAGQEAQRGHEALTTTAANPKGI